MQFKKCSTLSFPLAHWTTSSPVQRVWKEFLCQQCTEGKFWLEFDGFFSTKIQINFRFCYRFINVYIREINLITVNFAIDRFANGAILSIIFNRNTPKRKAINVNSVEKILHVAILWLFIDEFILVKRITNVNFAIKSFELVHICRCIGKYIPVRSIN